MGSVRQCARAVTTVAMIGSVVAIVGCASIYNRPLPVTINVPRVRVPLAEGAESAVDLGCVPTFCYGPGSGYFHIQYGRQYEEALTQAIRGSNLFAPDQVAAMSLVVNVQHWRIPGAGWKFPSVLSVTYALTDLSGMVAYSQTITTEASDDTNTFIGAERYSRSASLNLDKQLAAFIETLKRALLAYSKDKAT